MNQNLLIFKKINLRILNVLFDWGLGIGDWGLGIGDWAQSPIPNPQSPIPNPQIVCMIKNKFEINILYNI